VGVIKAGWHCGSQPSGGGCAANCPICQDCDGNCNCVAADGDPRVSSLNTAGDCKKSQCSGGSPTSANDDSDKPADVAGDCKKANCSNGSPTSVNDDSDKPGATAAPADFCKTCSNGSLVADPSKNGQVVGTDKCKECKDGAPTDINVNPTVNTLSYTYGFPVEPITKINESLEKLTKFGIIAKLSGPSIQGQIQESECCEATLGKGTKLAGSVTGTIGSLSVKGKIWPLGPIPTWDPPEVDLGFVSLDVKMQFIGGIFLGLDLTANGMIGYKKDPCSQVESDRAGCFNAEAAVTLTPKISAELGGEGSLTYDCLFFCDKTTISLSASFIFGELAWPITLAGVSYNKEDCSARLKGGEIMANPAEFKISARFSGSYQKEGEASHTIDFTRDFVACTITLDAVTCNF
jgi:hypothetical protein